MNNQHLEFEFEFEVKEIMSKHIFGRRGQTWFVVRTAQ